MAITRVQNQINFTQKPVAEPQGSVTMERLVQLPKTHYRHCTDIPDSVNNIRPERGQGHLIGNNPIKALGRFFSNRYYDLKSVYKGYTGTANDHQLGRTNDVGLVAGGLGIAAFLATKRGALLPKHMEFIGLGSFLTSMALWPKIGVFGPARLIHGFDVDKRYIDDQGRNKSVLQDPNYVPFDLFDGRRKSENLDDIATYMGISKDAENRDDMAKDQIVKIARQNNTLWMISSGGAVPIMTALMSNLVEKAYTPYLFAQKSKRHDAELTALHTAIRENTPIASNKKVGLEKSVSKVLLGLSEKQFVSEKQIYDALNSASEGLNSEFKAGLSREICGTLDNAAQRQVVVDEKYIAELAKNLETKFQGHPHLKKTILSVDEITAVVGGGDFKKGKIIDKADLLDKIKNAGIAKLDAEHKAIMSRRYEKILNEGETLLPKSKKLVMTEEVKTILKSIAEPIQRYADKVKRINAVNELQMGPDSVNAHYWGKLEKAFFEITIPDKSIGKLKKLMDNKPDVTQNVVTSLENLVKDEKAYAKAVSAINDIKMSYLKEILGSGFEGQCIDVVLGNANGKLANWVERAAGKNGNKIDKFIEMHKIIADELANDLVKSAKLGEAINTFTGIIRTNVPNNEAIEQVSKLENFVSACDRIIHALDFYKRADLYKNSGDAKIMAQQLGKSGAYITPGWINELFEKGKIETIAATSNDVFTRYNLKDKPQKFQSFANLMYPCNGEYVHLNEATINALGPKEMVKINVRLAEIEKLLTKEGADIAKLAEEKNLLLQQKASIDTKALNNSLSTIKSWMSRYLNIAFDIFHEHKNGMGGNVDLNWQFPGFKVGSENKYPYDKLKTPDAKYKIQAKNLVELADQGIKQAHNSGKWFRTFGGLFVGIFAASVATQFFFGKKDSTIPLEKDRLRQQRLAARAARMEARRAN